MTELKKYTLSLSPEYCKDWTVGNAIRELLQNGLDDPSTFEYDFSEDGKIYLTSKGVELPASTLLLGTTTKRGDGTSVGGFGEGYKLALLILTREGYKVEVLNGGKLWTPIYEYSEDFEVNTLVMYETPLEDNDDLTFIVHGVDDNLKSEIIEDCLYLNDDLGEVLEGSIGRVLLDKGGKLYVGGLFVTNIPTHKYSYDFKPNVLKLNRDRKSVESFDLAWQTSRLLSEIKPLDEIVQLVKAKNRDVEFVINHNHDLKNVAYQNFKKEHTEDSIVAEDYNEKCKLEEEGYENVVILNNDNYRDLVTQSSSYQRYLRNVELPSKDEEEGDQRSPIEMLEDWYTHDENMGGSITFEEMLDLFKERGLKWDEQRKHSKQDEYRETNIPF